MQPFINVRVDLVDLGKLAKNHDSQARYLLTFYCCFSHFLDGKIKKNKEANTVATAISLLAIKYGCPGRAEITTDQGLEFENSVLQRHLDSLGIAKLKISSYNPKANRVERTHQEFKKILQNKMSLKISLEEKIELSLYSYNHLESKSLNWESPFKTLFGYEPNFLELFAVAQEQTEKLEAYEESVNLGEERKAWIKNLNKSHMSIAKNRFNEQVSDFDNICENIQNIQVGDLVLAKSPKNEEGKTKFNWEGPFIVKKVHLNSYTLECLYTCTMFNRNRSFIKKLHVSEEQEKLLKSRDFIVKSNFFFPISQQKEDDQECY